jgi:hypothetical protein
MSSPAKNLLRLLGASVFIVILAVALNFTVDPLQLLRPARLFVAMYSQESRLQNAGLIRSQEFDTVFMGTSLAIHYRPSDIDRNLGVRSVKLVLPGSTSKEQKFVLDAALERHPKRILWEMDDWIFRDATDIDSNIHMPADLYRRNAKGIASYLFSGSMARESAWIALRSFPPLQSLVARLTTDAVFRFPIANVDDIGALQYRPDVAGSYSTKSALTAFRRITDPVRNRYLAEGYDYSAMVRNFERDAIGLIAGNPDVKFDIYFPPYSILQFVAMRDASPAALKIVYDFSGYAARRLLQFPNVRLYDFREAREITHDLNNYGDVIHHSPAVDLKVVSYLAAGKYAVDRRRRPPRSIDSWRRLRLTGSNSPDRPHRKEKAAFDLVSQPRAGIGAENRDAVDGKHHREGDQQHRDPQHRDRGEVAAFVEVVNQNRKHLGLRGEQNDCRR